MFILHLWNGKYGKGAKFVVEDKKTGKFAEFSPVRRKDIAWVTTDLTKEKDYKTWEDFEKEPVENLEDVMM